MTAKNDTKNNPVARLRDKFFKKKKNLNTSNELKEALRKKKEKPLLEEEKKIAMKSSHRDLDV